MQSKRETEAERTLEKSKENRVAERPRAKQKESRSLQGKGKELESCESGTGRGIVEKSESKRAGSEPFEIDFMDICRIDTPLVKRIPNSQRSAYATV